MGRVILKSDGAELLAYPPPFSCWLALSSDPDLTTFADWKQLHTLIWEELELPFADSFFVVNKNLQRPDQVAVCQHPEILGAHPHDTMHTWGDYIFSGSYRFTRADAEENLRLMQGLGVRPRVWTDHSNFPGNLLHRASTSATPETVDSSGHRYVNELYTLDLMHAAGVRYVWDGTLRKRVWGQDRPLTRWEWYRRYKPLKRLAMVGLDHLSRPLASYRSAHVFDYASGGNTQYYPHQFPDGTRMYCFSRFGGWLLGDIDGLGKLLAPGEVNRLVESGGTAIVYTHLGKRPVDRQADARHVPDATVEALTNVAALYRAGTVNVSPTSRLLDYLVLRDHIRFEGGILHFERDEIRFPDLSPQDLSGHSFGVRTKNPALGVRCNGAPVESHVLEPVGSDYRLRFP